MQHPSTVSGPAPSLLKALLLACATVAFLAASLGTLYLQSEPERAPATAAR